MSHQRLSLRQEKLSREDLDRLEAEVAQAKAAVADNHADLLEAVSKVESGAARPDLRKLFIASAQSNENRDIHNVIQHVCSDLGIEATRIFQGTRPGAITRTLHRVVLEADAILVDLSTANPNVMYEFGLAHGLGKPVLILATDTEAIPFDVANYRVLVFDKTQMGLQVLREQLKGALTELRARRRSKATVEWIGSVAKDLSWSTIARLLLP